MTGAGSSYGNQFTQSEAQLSLAGGFFAAAAGIGLAALTLRWVQGSWSGKTASRRRRWIAWGVALGVAGPSMQIVRGLLCSNEQTLAGGVVSLLAWPLILGGLGALGGTMFKAPSRRSAGSAKP